MFDNFLGLGGVTFKPDNDIPDLSGKVILVTGGTYLLELNQSSFPRLSSQF